MNILIIRFSSLGDIVMTAGVIEALKRRFPGASISYLTKRRYTGLFLDDPRIEKVYSVEGGLSEIKGLFAGIRFDAIVDLHATFRSRTASFFLNSPVTLRVDKHSFGRRFMVWTRNRWRRSFDTLDSYLATVAPLGVMERTMPLLVPSPTALDSIGKRIAALSGKPFGIAPGARHQEKRWNEASFAAVADEMAGKGYVPVFIGDKGDLVVIERIRALMKRVSVSFAGELDIAETVAFVSRCVGLVCNDSGPMHIAGAVGTPFAAVFGPTHPDLGFVPGYPSGIVLHSGASCSPCSLHGEKPCRFARRMCMEDIPWTAATGCSAFYNL